MAKHITQKLIKLQEFTNSGRSQQPTPVTDRISRKTTRKDIEERNKTENILGHKTYLRTLKRTRIT